MVYLFQRKMIISHTKLLFSVSLPNMSFFIPVPRHQSQWVVLCLVPRGTWALRSSDWKSVFWGRRFIHDVLDSLVCHHHRLMPSQPRLPILWIKTSSLRILWSSFIVPLDLGPYPQKGYTGCPTPCIWCPGTDIQKMDKCCKLPKINSLIWEIIILLWSLPLKNGKSSCLLIYDT